MRKGIAASIAVLALSLAGCTSLQTTVAPAPLSVDVEAKVKADIEVGQKISGKSQVTRIAFFTIGTDDEYADGAYTADAGNVAPIDFKGKTIHKAKQAAAYKAITASGADVIVAPKYTIREKDYVIFGIVEVEVEGYKCTIKSVK